MDLSALIFVALAVAWAAYLVPKALKHHEDVHRSRSVERFSHTMRVLARREPVGRTAARLVVTPMRRVARPRVETKASTAAPTADPVAAEDAPAPTVVRRPASAARRRRRVLGLLLLALAVVGTLAGLVVIHWGWVAVPATLLVGWLVACRLMVRGERARRSARPAAPAPDLAGRVASASERIETQGPADPLGGRAASDDSFGGRAASDDSLGGRAASASERVETDHPAEEPLAPGTWHPVPMTLPTYVDQPAARRTVQTIDLDSTGVWSSGRNDSDSALAREAEAAERTAREQAHARRASGA